MTETTAPLTPEREQGLRQQIAVALYERERPPRDPAWADAYPVDREVFEAMANVVLPVVRAVVAAETEQLRAEHGTWRKVGQRNLDRQMQENARLRAELAEARPRVLNEAATWFEKQCPDQGGALLLCMCHAAEPLRDLASAASPAREQNAGPVDPAVILGIGADQPDRWKHHNLSDHGQGKSSPSVEVLRALVADLVDPDPCHFDHHGYCQAHGWFDTDPACPHGRAKELGLVTDEDAK